MVIHCHGRWLSGRGIAFSNRVVTSNFYVLRFSLEALEDPDQNLIPSEHIEHVCQSIMSSDEQWSELVPQSGAASVWTRYSVGVGEWTSWTPLA